MSTSYYKVFVYFPHKLIGSHSIRLESVIGYIFKPDTCPNYKSGTYRFQVAKPDDSGALAAIVAIQDFTENPNWDRACSVQVVSRMRQGRLVSLSSADFHGRLFEDEFTSTTSPPHATFDPSWDRMPVASIPPLIPVGIECRLLRSQV